MVIDGWQWWWRENNSVMMLCTKRSECEEVKRKVVLRLVVAGVGGDKEMTKYESTFVVIVKDAGAFSSEGCNCGDVGNGGGSDCGVNKSRGMVIAVVEVEGSEPEQDNVGTH